MRLPTLRITSARLEHLPAGFGDPEANDLDRFAGGPACTPLHSGKPGVDQIGEYVVVEAVDQDEQFHG
jgi:hypothetical protein